MYVYEETGSPDHTVLHQPSEIYDISLDHGSKNALPLINVHYANKHKKEQQKENRKISKNRKNIFISGNCE
jgi:hypothetical protein